MKSILVPTVSPNSVVRTLQTADLLARKFGASIHGISLNQQDPFALGPEHALLMAYEEREIEQRSELLRSIFHEFASTQCPNGSDIKPRVTYNWIKSPPCNDDSICRVGQDFDMIILPRPEMCRHGLRTRTFTNVVLSTGRPVLLCSTSAPKHIGERVAVIYRGNACDMRAIALSVPILARAERISVIASGDLRAPTARFDVVAWLTEHGVPTHRLAFLACSGTSKEILATISDIDCDLVVGGAYGRGYFSEAIFGGLTCRIVDEISMPALLAHKA